MSMRLRIDFPDKTVSYRTFIRDLAAHIVKMLHEERNDPEFMSTRQAYATFGRRNVERWRKAGKAKPYVRPGKTEYETAQLRLLQRTEQDYNGK
jgi:hypothetical protein